MSSQTDGAVRSLGLQGPTNVGDERTKNEPTTNDIPRVQPHSSFLVRSSRLTTALLNLNESTDQTTVDQGLSPGSPVAPRNRDDDQLMSCY
jgi:hypothetical protein